jgi:hypothetical protein
MGFRGPIRCDMKIIRLPAGFVVPAQPIKAAKPPSDTGVCLLPQDCAVVAPVRHCLVRDSASEWLVDLVGEGLATGTPRAHESGHAFDQDRSYPHHGRWAPGAYDRAKIDATFNSPMSVLWPYERGHSGRHRPDECVSDATAGEMARSIHWLTGV